MKFKNLFALAILTLSLSAWAVKAKQIGQPTCNTKQTNALVLKKDELYGEPVLKLSFNGASNGIGKLTVTNSDGHIVYSVDEIELVPEPYYTAMALKDLPTGELKFSVTTKTSTFTSKITL